MNSFLYVDWITGFRYLTASLFSLFKVNHFQFLFELGVTEENYTCYQLLQLVTDLFNVPSKFHATFSSAKAIYTQLSLFNHLTS